MNFLFHWLLIFYPIWEKLSLFPPGSCRSVLYRELNGEIEWSPDTVLTGHQLLITGVSCVTRWPGASRILVTRMAPGARILILDSQSPVSDWQCVNWCVMSTISGIIILYPVGWPGWFPGPDCVLPRGPRHENPGLGIRNYSPAPTFLFQPSTDWRHHEVNIAEILTKYVR